MRKIGITDASRCRWFVDAKGWLNIELAEEVDAKTGGVRPEVYDDGGRRQQVKWGLQPAPEVYSTMAREFPPASPSTTPQDKRAATAQPNIESL